jgi:YfiH family protein
MADPQAGVAAAVHAGWRGAVNGILAAAVETMEAKGARSADIIAVVGPCIGRDSYEVGPEFPEPFLEESAENRRFFAPAARTGHHQFDLESYVVEKLHRLGLGSVAALGLDTCALEENFFSYRRSQIRHEADYGRLLSAIAL